MIDLEQKIKEQEAYYEFIISKGTLKDQAMALLHLNENRKKLIETLNNRIKELRGGRK